jgi:hypothetical protein
MRFICGALLFLSLALAACSKHLEVRVFNGTAEAIHVCSLSSTTECIDVAASLASGVMRWREGQFRVESDGCTRHYQVPVVENLDSFRRSPAEPVNVVITLRYELRLVRQGKTAELTSAEDQPPGYPALPLATGPKCK